MPFDPFIAVIEGFLCVVFNITSISYKITHIFHCSSYIFSFFTLAQIINIPMVDAPRQQRRSELDWLRTDVDCSGGRWRPKHVPESTLEQVTISTPANLNYQQVHLETDDNVAEILLTNDDNESICSRKTNSNGSIDIGVDDNGEPQHNDYIFNMNENAGQCVVITQPDDEVSSSTYTDDELSDDDSIADAVVHLAMAENRCRLVDMEDDDDVHSLNSYVCFPDPRHTEKIRPLQQ